MYILLNTIQASEISFEPINGEFIYNCPFDIDIFVDTKNIATNTISVAIYTDETIFAINDFSSKGGIFKTYTTPIRGNAHFGENKKTPFIYIVGTTASQRTFKGKGKFGTITVTPLIGVEEMDIKFYMIPKFDSDDSNISYKSGDKIHDSLDTVINANYTLKRGKCVSKQDKSERAYHKAELETPKLISNEQIDEEANIAPQEHQNKTQGKSKILDTLIQNKLYIVIGFGILIIALLIRKILKKD